MASFCASRHELVEGALRLRELARHRERARHVRRVEVVLATRVHEADVAVLQHVGPGAVVEDRRVRAGGDDRAVAGARTSAAAERVLDLRLHLVLAPSWLAVAHRRHVRLGGDLGRLAEPLQLVGRLHEAQLVENAAAVHDRARRTLAEARAAPQAVQDSRDAHVPRRVVAEPEPERLGALDECGELRLELRDRVRLVGAVALLRALHPCASPGPDLLLAIARAHEQDELRLPAGDTRSTAQPSGSSRPVR